MAFTLAAEFASATLRQVAAATRAWQGRMRVVAGGEHSTKPTIYFLTPDFQEPSGGIRVIYRHVDILNSAGIEACVLHQRRGFRCRWFENETRIEYAGDTKVLRGDVLVIPEVCTGILDNLAPSTRYIIFNQNAHLTWKGTTHPVARCYNGDGLVGIVTVSEHSQEMLRYAFEHVDIRRIHVGVDARMFHCVDGSRPNRIAYMPRRMSQDAHQVIELLRGRGFLDAWDVVPLDRMSQTEVAAQLRTTKIFLALSHQEGFGLPPAEAMACGNYVAGYHGFGGREFFRPGFSFAVEAGDVLGFARAVRHAIEMEHTQPGWCQERGAMASQFILSEYSLNRERQEVTRMYTDFLKTN